MGCAQRPRWVRFHRVAPREELGKQGKRKRDNGSNGQKNDEERCEEANCTPCRLKTGGDRSFEGRRCFSGVRKGGRK